MIGVGSVLAETYRVEAELGRGGMSVVYIARHLRLPTRVAIKVLQAHLTDATVQSRFRREAEVLAALKHPNIVAAHDFNEADGLPFLVMEYLEGEDLAQRMARNKQLPLAETLALARQIGSGLTAAHERGIVHRDLKPQNVFLCRPATDAGEPVVKLLDFGISKLLGSTDRLTRSELTMGTPSYMSPEQARGDSGQVDSRADQFSLGVLLYEMLSGIHPFRRDVPLVTMSRILTAEPPPIAGVPDAIMRALSRALSKRPAERWDSVAELVSALDHAAGVGGAGDRARRAPRSRRVSLALVALALLTLAIGGVVALRLGHRPYATPPATGPTTTTSRPLATPPPPATVTSPPPAPVAPAKPEPAPGKKPRHPPNKPKLDPEFRLEDPFAPKR
jgi:serine/threonine protein kinase